MVKKLIVRNIIKINLYSEKKKDLLIQKILYIKDFLNASITFYWHFCLSLQV